MIQCPNRASSQSSERSSVLIVFFYCISPCRDLQRFKGLRLFHFSLSAANSAAFLLSRWGTSPKIDSGVGLTQIISTCRNTRCSSRRRMWLSQFHRLSLARMTTSSVGLRAYSSFLCREIFIYAAGSSMRSVLE